MMKINLEYLECLYNKLTEEQKENQDITCFEDFRSYIAGLVLSNLQYDFDVEVEYDDIFIEDDVFEDDLWEVKR